MSAQVTVGEAKRIAMAWLAEHGRGDPGFVGAVLHGSAAWLDEHDVVPPTSDIDLLIVQSGTVAGKRRKFTYRGLVLDVSYLSAAALESAEMILGNHSIAGSFRGQAVIDDPTGQLTQLCGDVSLRFAERKWVLKRCASARDRLLSSLVRCGDVGPMPEKVISWLFASGITTHVLLVAGLRNPTVRRRYAAVRELLETHGKPDLHELLLKQLGCNTMSPRQVLVHLHAGAEAFDQAGEVLKTDYPFAGDIARVARSATIDGSRELIEQHRHREAVFWIAVTYSRCQIVLDQDAPSQIAERHLRGYGNLLADLGVPSAADLEDRCRSLTDFLPHLWDEVQSIMGATPEIRDGVMPAT